MLRPLLTLLLGVLLAVIIAVAISPSYTWREVLLPVLITASFIVLAGTARRASLRDTAQAMADAEHAQANTASPASPASERPDSDQETDRG
jgi:c-di-AMP phosphodiesterase-like protein